MREPQQLSELRQAEVILALSLATDLGTGRPMEWAMRSALLGIRLGDALGLSEQELREVYYCTLLLYVGCTSEIELALQMFGDDPASVITSVDFIDQGDPQAMMAWMRAYFGAGVPPEQRPHFLSEAGTLIARYKTAHCEVAQQLADRLKLEAPIQHALKQMGEKWNGEGVPHGLRGDEIVLPMRIALLVRDLEPWLNTHGVDAAIAVARQRSGGVHDPHLADQFCQLAPRLCASLEHDAQWDGLLRSEPQPRLFTESEVDEALLVFADFIDLLSPFLTGHSRSVATLTEHAARECGVPHAKALWRAGLVHDIGKIAVPHGLWSAQRPLSRGEWERVRLHPYYTERILARPDALAHLGMLATAHHESLDGSGYHRHLRAESLSPGMRLLAAANFYCARREARPNRPPPARRRPGSHFASRGACWTSGRGRGERGAGRSGAPHAPHPARLCSRADGTRDRRAAPPGAGLFQPSDVRGAGGVREDDWDACHAHLRQDWLFNARSRDAVRLAASCDRWVKKIKRSGVHLMTWYAAWLIL